MTSSTWRRAVRAVPLAALAAVLPTTAAVAATPARFECSATAVTARVLSGTTQSPIGAGDPDNACRGAVAGLEGAGTVLAKNAKLEARTAYAAVTTAPMARAGVEGLSTVPAGLPLSVDAARSSASASCASGRPVYASASRVGSITLGGKPIVVDGVVQPITDGLTKALGGVLAVRLNETTDLPGGGRVVRAAHVTVGSGAGTVADVVIAESRLTATGNPCDPSVTDDPKLPTEPAVCADGSVLDVGRGRCVIPVPGSQTPDKPQGTLTGPGSVVVGAPLTGPRGGTVVSLATARARYPHSRCLRGRGPDYAVIGTAGSDDIAGTRRGDRILGLGGADRLDGRNGADCLEGAGGIDRLTGRRGADRLFGGAGADLVIGGAGNDRLRAGRGNDYVDAGYGSDHVFGGGGQDMINVVQARKRVRVYGGTGRDTARCRPRELHRLRGIERIFATRRQH